MSAPYDKAALEAEIPRLETQLQMFEDKAQELREQIAQYRVWIKEHEKEEQHGG